MGKASKNKGIKRGAKIKQGLRSIYDGDVDRAPAARGGGQIQSKERISTKMRAFQSRLKAMERREKEEAGKKGKGKGKVKKRKNGAALSSSPLSSSSSKRKRRSIYDINDSHESERKSRKRQRNEVKDGAAAVSGGANADRAAALTRTEARRPGESMKQFKDRLAREKQQLLAKFSQRDSKRSAKRAAYFEAKKQKKKQVKQRKARKAGDFGGGGDDDDDIDDNASFGDGGYGSGRSRRGEASRAHRGFGEQSERPPEFTSKQLRRLANVAGTKKVRTNLGVGAGRNQSGGGGGSRGRDDGRAQFESMMRDINMAYKRGRKK